MSNKKTTKRGLFASVFAMLLCVAMFVGATFAWFTDSVTSGNNNIQAGNLDIEVYHRNAFVVSDSSIESETELFRDVNGNAMLWEPGAMSYETFTVKNEGSLALKYKLAMNILDYNALDGHTLKEVLKVKVLTGDAMLTPIDRANVIALDWNTTDTLDVFNTSGNLAAGASDVFQVIVYWVPGANDNDFNVNNGKNTSDGAPLFINFGINVVASQLNQENDSFGPDYDQGIVLPDLPISINKVFQSAPIVGNSVAESVEIKNVSTNASVATMQAASVNAVISALKAEATDKAADSDLSTVIYLDIQTADTTETSVTYEINLSATLSYTDTNGNAQETTLEELNGKLADKIVTATMEIGKGLSNVTVKHHDTPMTKLAAVNTEAEGYYYNKTTGVLTIKSKSFSPFTVNYTIEGVAAVGDKVYSTLDEAVAAANDGDTVVLLKDVVLTYDLQLGGNGKSLTLNLNKHTVDGGEYQVYTAGVGTINICSGTIKNANTDNNSNRAALYIPMGCIAILDNVTLEGYYGLYANGTVDIKNAVINAVDCGIAINYNAKVTIGSTTEESTIAVTASNGNCISTQAAEGATDMNVTIYNGNFTSIGTDWKISVIYWASHGTLNVYGGTFKNETSGTGAAGLLQKNGTVNVYGGTFNAKDGIKIVAQSDSKEIITKIEGGAFAGTRSGIYIDASNSTYMGQLTQYGVSIANGNSVPTFMGGTEGAIYTKTGGLGSRTLMTITGGKFSSDPSSYVAIGYAVELNGDWYSIIQTGNGFFSGGFGTTESPYLMSTKQDMLDLLDHALVFYGRDPDRADLADEYERLFYRACYKMTNDIDISDTPIRNLGGYQCLFDGNGHTLTVNFTSESNIGMGNTVGMFAVFNGSSNSYIYEATTEEQKSSPYAYEINGKTYMITAGAIRNLTIEGTVYSNIGSVAPLGGSYSTGYIINVTNKASVTAEGSASFVGGIVCGTKGTGLVIDCSNYGTIICTGNTSPVGGITAQLYGGSSCNGTYPDIAAPYSASVINCHNYGTIKAADAKDVGGIVGQTHGYGGIRTISGCSNSGEIIGGTNVGGIIARHSNTGGTLYLFENENIGTVTGTNSGAIIGTNNGTMYDSPKES